MAFASSRLALGVATRSLATVGRCGALPIVAPGRAWATLLTAPTPASSTVALRSVAATPTLRRFSSAAKGVEERVIGAVQRYAQMRIDELNKEEGTDEHKAKLLESLKADVTAATKWEDLGFDDLDKVEVLLEVEDEFNHTMPDDEADAINSVSETIAYMQKHSVV